jgi:hypothetical protein
LIPTLIGSVPTLSTEFFPPYPSSAKPAAVSSVIHWVPSTTNLYWYSPGARSIRVSQTPFWLVIGFAPGSQLSKLPATETDWAPPLGRYRKVTGVLPLAAGEGAAASGAVPALAVTAGPTSMGFSPTSRTEFFPPYPSSTSLAALSSVIHWVPFTTNLYWYSPASRSMVAVHTPL